MFGNYPDQKAHDAFADLLSGNVSPKFQHIMLYGDKKQRDRAIKITETYLKKLDNINGEVNE